MSVCRHQQIFAYNLVHFCVAHPNSKMTGSVNSKPKGATDSLATKDMLSAPKQDSTGVPCRPPLAPPPFGVQQIREVIPKHCFKRNLIKSLGHVALDLIMAATIFYASTYISWLPFAARFVAWPVYWIAQGITLTGLWVMAHECGHGAFSDYRSVNDLVGWIIHSCLLVPYFSWKYSHAAHHRNTCSIENDEVFVPATRSDFAGEMISETPIVNAIQIIGMLTVGW